MAKYWWSDSRGALPTRFLALVPPSLQRSPSLLLRLPFRATARAPENHLTGAAKTLGFPGGRGEQRETTAALFLFAK